MFRHSLVVLVSVVALLSVGCSLRSHRVGMPDWGNVPQDLVDDVVQDTAVPADLIVPEDGVSQDLGDDVRSRLTWPTTPMVTLGRMSLTQPCRTFRCLSVR